MVVSWVMLEKNKSIYKYKLLDNAQLFNRNVMNLQIEGWNTADIKLDFNDIICIKTEDYLQPQINEIPESLKELHIKRSNLTTLPLFPKEIRSIQLTNSKIEITEEEIAQLRVLYPKANINITNYPFMEKDWVTEDLNEVRQNIDNIRREVIRRHDRPRFNVNFFSGDTTTNVLNTGQTVHITSINKCVIDAIEIIKNESKKYISVKDPIYTLFHNIKEGEKNTFYRYIINKLWNIQFTQLQIYVRDWCRDKQSHSTHELTFEKLFVMIITIIENHPSREDIKTRLKEELSDSIGLCFTGRINRMVNALVGFVDGIQVGISVKESLQMKIPIIIQKLIEKKIKKKQAKEEIMELFKDVGEQDNVTEHYKSANLLALEDFDDDEEEPDIKDQFKTANLLELEDFKEPDITNHYKPANLLELEDFKEPDITNHNKPANLLDFKDHDHSLLDLFDNSR